MELEIGTAAPSVTPLAPKARASRKAAPAPPAPLLETDGSSAKELAPVLEGTIIEPEQLATIEPDKRLGVFSAPGGLRPVLDVIAQVARAHQSDVSTEKGRAAIASLAYSIARCKTRLDDTGKDLVAELKALPNTIDANRRAMREELDALKDEVRRDLTAWEAGQDRQKQFVARISNWILGLGQATSAQVEASLKELEDLCLDEAPDFHDEAQSAKAGALQDVLQLLARRQQEEADAAELARLRAEQERRRQEQAEAERREREAQQREREAQEATQRAEQARLDAERRAQEAEARAAQEREEAQARAAREREEAVQREARIREEAAAAERERQARAAEAARQEEARKAADVEHRRAFNREALEDLLKVLAGDEDAAKAVLTAIYKREVRHIAITY